MTEDEFDMFPVQRGWGGQARDHARFAVVPVHCVEQSHRGDAAPTGKKRTTQRQSWALEKYAPVTSATAVRIHEEVTGDSQSEDGSRRVQRDPEAGGTGEEVR